MTAARDVVIVTFHFPPQGGAGSLRLLSFARHLPEHGWRPRVVTVGPLGTALVDPTLATRIPPQIQVERWFTPLAGWAYRSAGSGPKRWGDVGRAVLRRGLESFASHPDPAIGWSLATGWRLGQQFRATPPRVVLTSAPPHSLHAAGLVASTVAGVPWVVDLRDPWSGHPPSGLSRLRHLAGSLLERTALAEARCVLANTPRLAEALRSRARPPRRVVVVPNGYDEEEIMTARTIARERSGDGTFTIVHAGALYAGQRDPLDFLEALARTRETVGPARKMRFIIAGDSSFHRNPVLSERVRSLGLTTEVQSPGYLPHERVLATMASADLLLLIQGPTFHLQVPSKAYEYLALGRPVLALTDEGATADLVRSSRQGTVISPGRQDDVVRYLVTAMTQTSEHGTIELPSTISSRREIAARLAAVLDEVEAAECVY